MKGADCCCCCSLSCASAACVSREKERSCVPCHWHDCTTAAAAAAVATSTAAAAAPFDSIKFHFILSACVHMFCFGDGDPLALRSRTQQSRAESERAFGNWCALCSSDWIEGRGREERGEESAAAAPILPLNVPSPRLATRTCARLDCTSAARLVCVCALCVAAQFGTVQQISLNRSSSSCAMCAFRLQAHTHTCTSQSRRLDRRSRSCCCACGCYAQSYGGG